MISRASRQRKWLGGQSSARRTRGLTRGGAHGVERPTQIVCHVHNPKNGCVLICDVSERGWVPAPAQQPERPTPFRLPLSDVVTQVNLEPPENSLQMNITLA